MTIKAWILRGKRNQALIMLIGWVCPLTSLENWLCRKGGESGYATSFVEQYILTLTYPSALTWGVQFTITLVVLIVNAGIHGWVDVESEGGRSLRQRKAAARPSLMG